MQRRAAVLVTAFASSLCTACASQRNVEVVAAPAPAATEGEVGDELARAVRKDDLGEFDLTDAALIASGFESRPLLKSARARFESLIAPVLEPLGAVKDERERGRLLLASLHKKGGLLGEYDARATTLAEILDRRRYNCVSASVVYNILAERLGLEVSSQLLPTHARTLLRMTDARAKNAGPGAPKQQIIIETTSADGFDPDPRLEASILAQVGGNLADRARQLVPDRGSNVSTLVLIGTIYVNRASIVQEAGDLGAAERLFERGEAFAGNDEMRRVLRDQRAALLSQLGADDVISEDPARLQRAYRTLKAAVALDPAQPQIRAAVFQNLRAAAERMMHLISEKGEQALIALAAEAAAAGLEPADRSGLRAFALSEVARLRIDAGNFDGAVESIELALREQLGERDAKLKQALEQNRVSALRLAALTAAKAGEYSRSMQLIERIGALPGLSQEQRAQASQDSLRVIHLVGNKRIDNNDFKGAAEVYREGVRRFRNDETSRHNLIAVLERLTLPLVGQAQCQKAEEYLEEIRILEPSSKFPATARVRCLMERASERLKASDYAEAVSLMRAARETSPAEPTVLNNLAVALLRWTTSLSASGSCARAVTLVRELQTLDTPNVTGAEIKRALGSCRD